MLEKPIYSLTDLSFGPIAPDAMMSPRVAPPMIGLGLLEAIHESDILAAADPDDADGDGISGRVSQVADDETGEHGIGRFGWKAESVSLAQQTARAFASDMGISSPLIPIATGDCTRAQHECLAAPTGVQDAFGPTEASRTLFDLIVFYTGTVAPPTRRDIDDAQVLAGKTLFYNAGCIACHRPKYVTRRDATNPAHRFQLIWPYTDLLLHDMGEGLADHRPTTVASGREWRTAPLWGIGLTETVSGHTRFLHDGRARNLTEAILWHGGEAEAARQRFNRHERARPRSPHRVSQLAVTRPR